MALVATAKNFTSDVSRPVNTSGIRILIAINPIIMPTALRILIEAVFKGVRKFW